MLSLGFVCACLNACSPAVGKERVSMTNQDTEEERLAVINAKPGISDVLPMYRRDGSGEE